ncbi:MAG: class aldolase/adducin family protein [Acidimicrobiaceae bacterium]|nr:class aldolase/adducin family protein [Acidimicrobiaceae bacterium]
MVIERWTPLVNDDSNDPSGVSSSTGADVRHSLVTCGRKLLGLGLLSQTSGNLSAKLDNGDIYITPSSMEYDRMDDDDIVVVGPDGSVRQGSRTPSSETPLHCLVYETRPEISAIVHTHSPNATTLAVLGLTIPAVHYGIAVLQTTEIMVAAYATYGTEQLAQNVRAAFPAPSRAVLIANHGLVAIGETLKKAADAAEAVETLAGLYYRSLAIGKPNVLSEEQMAEVMEKYRNKAPV